MRRLAVPARAEVSSDGGLALTAVTGGAAHDHRATVPPTGKAMRFDRRTGGGPKRRTQAPTVAAAAAAGSPTDPVDADRTCAVPRNDPRTQVYQPHWRQVEWAADQAVAAA